MWLKVFSILGAMSELAMLWEQKLYYKMVSPGITLLNIIKPKGTQIPAAKLKALALLGQRIARDRVITHNEVLEVCDLLGVELKLKV